MAMIPEAFLDVFVDKLKSLVSEKLDMVLSVKEDLERLQRQLTRIQNFLEAAERRRVAEPAINQWVCELKDVVYDADAIIDLCRIKGDILPIDQPSSSERTSVCFSFSFLFSRFTSVPHRYQIAERIKSLNDRLEEIHKDRSQFNLEESRGKQKYISFQTAPSVEYDVVGSEIEEATKGLVAMIVQDLKSKLRVYAISGMGGIGKTTLAQKIYNNDKITIEFPKKTKVWICVSQSYNEIKLLQQVIRETGGDYGQANTKAELVPLLESTLKGKRIFLVLDDVWKADVWINLFRSPLMSAAAIVRILVTTRDESVAMGMGAMHTHRVNLLPDLTSWEMLCREIFVEGQEREIESLYDLGMQIVKKCSGLPLAIKAIAGVLAKKERNRKEWEKVLRNDAWTMSNLPEYFRGALYLSYDDLPSHLKQCFLYCSLFPEDQSINRHGLVTLWVAEGFVKEQRDSIMEEVAEEYLNELIKRNLLQPTHDNPKSCTMHDFLRALAKFLSHDEISSGNEMTATTISSKTIKLRRLAINNDEGISVINTDLIEQKCLRTLLTFNDIQVFNDNQWIQLERLRVLQINDMDIVYIPNYIDILIHLRYLNLSYTRIRGLPESIGNLTNLQFLILRACHALRTLPKSIAKLQNLRCLDLKYSKLVFIPKGVSKLKNINKLDGYVVPKPRKPVDFYSRLEELNSLYNLTKLSINIFGSARQGAASLQKLKSLVKLKVYFMEESHSEEIENVLEELCPPQGLNKLYIDGFFGNRFPSWMQSPFFGAHLSSLTALFLIDVHSCSHLPPAGELPKLSKLIIESANNVRRIGPEFLGGVQDGTHTITRPSFPNLQFLSLRYMMGLEEWTFGNELEETDQAQSLPNLMLLPRLDDLELNGCPKLEALPKCLGQTSMKKLHIQMAYSLRSVENLPNLKEELKIFFNKILERVSDLPALKVLNVRDCPALKCVEKLDSLQQLKLFDISMKGLPEWLARLLRERKLADDDDFIFECTCNKKAFTRMLKDGPDWSIIQSMPQVFVKMYGRSFFLRYTQKPLNYETNFEGLWIADDDDDDDDDYDYDYDVVDEDMMMKIMMDCTLEGIPVYL